MDIYETAQRLDEGLCLGVVHNARFEVSAEAMPGGMTPVRLAERRSGQFVHALTPFAQPFTAESCADVDPRLFFELGAGADAAMRLTTLRQLRAGMDVRTAERLPFEVICTADPRGCPDDLTVIRDLTGHPFAGPPAACGGPAAAEESCWAVEFHYLPAGRTAARTQFVSEGGRLKRVVVYRYSPGY